MRVQLLVQTFRVCTPSPDVQSTKFDSDNLWDSDTVANFAAVKTKDMEKDSGLKERLREKTPLIMAVVLGIALLLAIVIIASLLKLSFAT